MLASTCKSKPRAAPFSRELVTAISLAQPRPSLVHSACRGRRIVVLRRGALVAAALPVHIAALAVVVWLCAHFELYVSADAVSAQHGRQYPRCPGCGA